MLLGSYLHRHQTALKKQLHSDRSLKTLSESQLHGKVKLIALSGINPQGCEAWDVPCLAAGPHAPGKDWSVRDPEILCSACCVPSVRHAPPLSHVCCAFSRVGFF